jgi:hypothetical protein
LFVVVTGIVIVFIAHVHIIEVIKVVIEVDFAVCFYSDIAGKLLLCRLFAILDVCCVIVDVIVDITVHSMF